MLTMSVIETLRQARSALREDRNKGMDSQDKNQIFSSMHARVAITLLVLSFIAAGATTTVH